MTNTNPNKEKDAKPVVSPETQAILDQMKAMTDKIERLEKVANKARMAKLDENSTSETTIIKVRVIEGKKVLAWKSKSNKVYRDPRTKLIVEDQKLEVFFDDKTSQVMELITFNRSYSHIKCTLIEASTLTKNEDIAKYGIQKFKLETPEGESITIGSDFVN